MDRSVGYAWACTCCCGFTQEYICATSLLYGGLGSWLYLPWVWSFRVSRQKGQKQCWAFLAVSSLLTPSLMASSLGAVYLFPVLEYCGPFARCVAIGNRTLTRSEASNPHMKPSQSLRRWIIKCSELKGLPSFVIWGTRVYLYPFVWQRTTRIWPTIDQWTTSKVSTNSRLWMSPFVECAKTISRWQKC